MNEISGQSNNKSEFYKDEEIDLLKFWLIVKKQWKLLLALFIIAVTVTTVISLKITPTYRATTSMLPISSETVVWSIFSPAGVSISGGVETNKKKIMAILKSRTIRVNVINGMNLVEIMLDGKPEVRAPINVVSGMIGSMMTVSSEVKTGLIKITVDNKDPELARDIANQYVKELKSILIEKSLTVAKLNRIFIEEQFRNEEIKLKNYEEQMADFQKKTKMIEPTAYAQGTMDLYANLLSQKIAIEVELKKIETSLSEGNPQITALKNQLKEINYQIRNVEIKAQEGALPSLTSAPDHLIKYNELLRKVKNSQTLYEILSELYEKARFEEIKESLYVEVIDLAVKPEFPFKPKKRIMVGLAGVTSIIFGIFLVFFIERLKTNMMNRS